MTSLSENADSHSSEDGDRKGATQTQVKHWDCRGGDMKVEVEAEVVSEEIFTTVLRNIMGNSQYGIVFEQKTERDLHMLNDIKIHFK